MKKTVIITGATGGIGRATAHCFGVNGYAVVLADIADEKLSELEAELLANGMDASSLAVDLEIESSWNNLVRFALQKYGRVDALINNAAWRVTGSLRTTSLELWEKTLKICLTAPVFLAKAVAAAMEEQKSGGVIVNISSVMAERPSGLAPAYIAAKGALNSLTKELAITYGRTGIRVVGVAPGAIDTSLSSDYVDSRGENISQQLVDQMTDNIPLGRSGQAGEIARTIVWLCSADASYLTGTTITVDGGFQPNFNSYSIKKSQYPNEF
ncbi:SDR family NAD(P)-dependent oxidoreductase [Larkinella bovis]|uniref:SDR family NAD(P)-dependent oxidoreductase n=1 Tax=Larkinella bovis TaxID=683041 RepID=A0ABW0IG86_9BACT